LVVRISNLIHVRCNNCDGNVHFFLSAFPSVSVNFLENVIEPICSLHKDSIFVLGRLDYAIRVLGHLPLEHL